MPQYDEVARWLLSEVQELDLKTIPFKMPISKMRKLTPLRKTNSTTILAVPCRATIQAEPWTTRVRNVQVHVQASFSQLMPVLFPIELHALTYAILYRGAESPHVLVSTRGNPGTNLEILREHLRLWAVRSTCGVPTTQGVDNS